MKTQIACMVILAVALAWSDSDAQVPRLVHYQGELQDSSGEPLDGSVDLHFRLYKTPVGDEVIWSETHTNVQVSAGNYDVLLGSKNPLNLSFYEYYLAVDVEGQPRSGKRTAIVGSGYNYRLSFLFAAYTVVWLALAFYFVSISRRQNRISEEVKALAGLNLARD